MADNFFATAETTAAALQKAGFANVDPAALDRYASMLLAANEKFNLTAHRGLPAVLSWLFYDSLVPYAPQLFADGTRVLDIGSGAGVPGLLLKLAFPKLEVTIIEASNKKCAFITEVAAALHLDVTVLCQRGEIFDPKMREQYDLVTARAVAPLRVLLELLAPYAKVGGLVVCPKSKKLSEEIEEAGKTPKLVGLSLKEITNKQSLTGAGHAVVIYKKVKKTDPKIQRKWSQMISKPL